MDQCWDEAGPCCHHIHAVTASVAVQNKPEEVFAGWLAEGGLGRTRLVGSFRPIQQIHVSHAHFACHVGDDVAFAWAQAEALCQP